MCVFSWFSRRLAGSLENRCMRAYREMLRGEHVVELLLVSGSLDGKYPIKLLLVSGSNDKVVGLFVVQLELLVQLNHIPVALASPLFSGGTGRGMAHITLRSMCPAMILVAVSKHARRLHFAEDGKEAGGRRAGHGQVRRRKGRPGRA